jgi:hypothetical protein
MIGIDPADGIITFMPEPCQSGHLMEAESASSSYPSAWLLRSVQKNCNQRRVHPKV